MLVKIINKKEIAAGTIEVELTSTEEVIFNAGQFFSLSLINPTFSDDRGNRRMFGFVNSPAEKKLVRFVTRTGISTFKKYLLETKIGTEMEISGIGGSMVLPEDTGIPLNIITGGIGIAPYLSMFAQIQEKSLPHKIKLIYANTNRAVAIYLDELEVYSEINPNIKLISELTDGNGLNEETVKNNLDFNAKYYISGTPRFVPAMVRILRKLGVLPTQMKFEIFTGY
jgi:ferredoxin-NADP reductase